jgi:hypothetical protein
MARCSHHWCRWVSCWLNSSQPSFHNFYCLLNLAVGIWYNQWVVMAVTPLQFFYEGDGLTWWVVTNQVMATVILVTFIFQEVT